MNYDESIRARQHIDGWKLVTSFSVRGFEWLGFLRNFVIANDGEIIVIKRC